jgi:excinuclease ABC subunit C
MKGVANPVTYRPKTGEIPLDPGVYRFRDEHGRVIYVGKAKNLRSRLNSYFANPQGLLAKTRSMVFTAASVEWTVVGSELEALQLEYTWIKEFNPRFNVMFRDDKSYPYLAVTMGEKYPRVQVMRGDKKKDTRYFGPFYPAKAIRETVDTMLRVFPVRTCSSGVFKRAERTGRPCLLGYIDKCSAPCVGRISPEDHKALAGEFCDFMSGEAKKFISGLEKKKAAAVAELDYESAARLRDDIAALRRVFERNTVVLSEDTDADIFALKEDELEAAAQVFHVRGGRIRGQRGWVVEKVEDMDTPDLVEHLLQQVYGEGSSSNEQIRRAGDITTRSAALQELQEALDLPQPLMRIECFDISHVQGTNVVASMVVVEDGLPRKSEYRKFSITGDAARDDTASMYDVIHRRFRNYLAGKGEQRAAGPDPAVDPVDDEASVLEHPDVDAQGEPVRDTTTAISRNRFAYPHSLVVVDGGPPQVAAASRALADLGIDDVFVIGLAKRLEEVWIQDSEFPVILPRASEGLFLLQRIRDEAHRFAITFHRQKRGKSMTASALDEVPGLGPAKRKALLKHFGSVKKIRAATVEDLVQVPGVGPALAETIRTSLAADDAAAPAVNMTTGEIIED